MNTFEEVTDRTLQSLFTKIDELKQIKIRDMLNPDVYYHYEQTIQKAYDGVMKKTPPYVPVGL